MTLAMMAAAAGLAAVVGCTSLKLKDTPLVASPEKSMDTKLSMARLLERHGEPSQAKSIYDAILAKDPESHVAYHRLGVLAAKRGDYAQAGTLFEQAAARTHEPSAELLNDIGYNHYLQHRLPEAQEALRQSLEVAPEYEAAWTNLGLVLGAQEKFDDALSAFRRAGTDAQAQANLAYVHAQRRELEKSQARYREALALDQNLRPAAEGLLQVSQQIPGQRPVSVASTIARLTRPALPEPGEPRNGELRAVSGPLDDGMKFADDASIFSWPADQPSPREGTPAFDANDASPLTPRLAANPNHFDRIAKEAVTQATRSRPASDVRQASYEESLTDGSASRSSRQGAPRPFSAASPSNPVNAPTNVRTSPAPTTLPGPSQPRNLADEVEIFDAPSER